MHTLRTPTGTTPKQHKQHTPPALAHVHTRDVMSWDGPALERTKYKRVPNINFVYIVVYIPVQQRSGDAIAYILYKHTHAFFLSLLCHATDIETRLSLRKAGIILLFILCFARASW